MEKGKSKLSLSVNDKLDTSLQLAAAHLTGGISPAALLLAFYDWFLHIRIQPSKQLQLLKLAQNNFWHLAHQYMAHLSGDNAGEFCALTSPQDNRFKGKLWQHFPYTFYYESFLMLQDWWHQASSDVRGVSKHHQDVVDFTIRQILDMLSPSNSLLFNPEIQNAMMESHGLNFVKGFQNLFDDIRRYQQNLPPAGAENFIVGNQVGVTPGKVIYRNRLMELIQYTPVTDVVYAEPILICPAWIMKYYILDLTPKHSLVRYLVNKGHTVYMISWKNPRKKDAQMGMGDYLDLGILSALEVIAAIQPQAKTHLVGYCLGGTLSAIAAAVLARDNRHPLATLTLFAAQTDFTEPGELNLFIDDSQITFLESLMKEKGYLDTHQMSGAFQLLRSNDLIWSRLVREYLMGERKPLTDLMAWNADATRLPYQMHSDYLRQLFLNNQLAEGHYTVDNKPIALTDIDIPIFVVATERDHVSPWKSVFKINLLTDVDVTFVLTSGGHNVGIVSMPVKKTKRYYRQSTLHEKDRYLDPDTWHQQAKIKNGSWWPAFEKWICTHSTIKIEPPSMGSSKHGYEPIEEAPGSYVQEK